jgi:hypothetical protein
MIMSEDTRKAREAIRFELALTCGDSDVYGWCMGWWFPIAEIVYAVDPEAIPRDWQFRPSPFLAVDGMDHLRDDPDYETSILLDMFDNGSITVDDLVYWGRALTFYAAQCHLAGRAY